MVLIFKQFTEAKRQRFEKRERSEVLIETQKIKVRAISK